MVNYEEKIRKLLALAGSDNEHEAKSALLKARELMAIHKIEEIDLVDIAKRNVKRIVTGIEYTKKGEWWIGILAQVIAENYCCRCLYTKYHHCQKMTIIFVGLDGDVDICEKIFTYAIDSARSCSKYHLENMEDYKRYTSATKNRIKNSYSYGFALGVQEALEDQKRKKNESEARWGLVMVVPKEVNDYCSGIKVDKYSGRHSVYDDEISSGYQEGRKFNPNKRIPNKA